MKIILATANEHKAKEINKMLENTNIEVVTYANENIQIDEIIEDGNTFEQNALIKAKAIKEKTNLPVLSDDSGLVVDGLNGFPGINTARFALEQGGYDNAMNELNNRLKGKDNSASFKCVLCYIDENNKIKYFIGEVKGNIVDAKKGDNGFGYDPCFKPLGYDLPFSLLDEQIKNTISHRYNALKQLIDYLSN